jgi:DUF971 family protein
MANPTREPWPTQIRLVEEGRLLTIDFDDGARVELTSARLRIATPSVEAKRLTQAEREALIGSKPVKITAIEPVGNYAIRPTFDDGHSTGIYSWTYLAQLGREAK